MSVPSSVFGLCSKANKTQLPPHVSLASETVFINQSGVVAHADSATPDLQRRLMVRQLQYAVSALSHQSLSHTVAMSSI